MELDKIASHLALAMDAMIGIDGILRINSDSSTEGKTRVQVSEDFFTARFKVDEIEMINRDNLKYPIEARADLNGITFFAILMDKEFAELYRKKEERGNCDGEKSS